MNRFTQFLTQLRPFEQMYLQRLTNYNNNPSIGNFRTLHQKTWVTLYNKLKQNVENSVFLSCVLFAFNNSGMLFQYKNDEHINTFEQLFTSYITNESLVNSNFGLNSLNDDEFTNVLECVNEFVENNNN